MFVSGLKPAATVCVPFPAGACQHALGYHAAAAADYQACITADRVAANDEARGQQLAAFYQRELALYRHRRLDRPVADFCPDHDLHPIFKARSSSPCPQGMCGASSC